MWHRAKPVLRGKFIGVNANINNEKTKTKSIRFYLKELEKDQQSISKISRRKTIKNKNQ